MATVSTTTAAKDIPAIPDNTDPSLRTPLQRMREEIQRLDGFIGDHLDMAVTWRQLFAQGYATQNQLPPTGGAAPGTVSIPSGSLVYTPDLTPPPDVTGLAAVAGFTDVIVTTDAPTYTQGHGPGSTRIYAAKKDPLDPTMPVFGDASLVYEGFGALSVFALPSEPNLRWHIWAKWKSADGVESVNPAGGTNGVITTTGQDVTQLLDSLTHAVYDPAAPYTKVGFRADMFYIAPNATFYQDTTPTATAVGQLWFAPSTGITKTWDGSTWAAFDVPLPFVVNTTTVVEDGVSIPPGVYMDAAYIRNLNAMFARFGTAVIDDAMIASLTASKVTAGSLAVGADITSTGFVTGSTGWRIQGNGNAEFAAAVIRGQLIGSQIAADSITTNHIQVGAVTATAQTTFAAVTRHPASGGDPLPYTDHAISVTFLSTGHYVRACFCGRIGLQFNNNVKGVSMTLRVGRLDAADVEQAFFETFLTVPLMAAPASLSDGDFPVNLQLLENTPPAAGTWRYSLAVLDFTLYDSTGTSIAAPATSNLIITGDFLMQEYKV